MTLTFNPQLENSSLNAIRDAIDSGDGPGAIELYAGATLIASLELPKPSFSNEPGGQSSLVSPAQGVAVAAGQPDSFKFVTSYGATVFTGAVPADLTVDFTPSGAAVVATFTLEAGVVLARQFASTTEAPYRLQLDDYAQCSFWDTDATPYYSCSLGGQLLGIHELALGGVLRARNRGYIPVVENGYTEVTFAARYLGGEGPVPLKIVTYNDNSYINIFPDFSITDQVQEFTFPISNTDINGLYMFINADVADPTFEIAMMGMAPPVGDGGV